MNLTHEQREMKARIRYLEGRDNSGLITAQEQSELSDLYLQEEREIQSIEWARKEREEKPGWHFYGDDRPTYGGCGGM